MDQQTFFDRLLSSCGDKARLETPNLGNDVPDVYLLYTEQACHGIPAHGVGIYVRDAQGWQQVYIGPYNRGSNFADRGGRSYRYRLVNDTDPSVFLVFRKGELVLEGAGQSPMKLWPL